MPSESQEFNNIFISQIWGGIGGAGGSGGQEGGGGLPDTRLQPLLEASGFEEPSREFTGAAQNLHRGIGGTQTLYDRSYRQWPLLAGFDEQDPSSDSHASFSAHSIPALDPFRHSALQFPNHTSPSSIFPPPLFHSIHTSRILSTISTPSIKLASAIS
ncbi:hypothetical protein B0H13DRAFT_2552046 [Mycena leptocephala]|nr:hypothetical protein B0H13DRAFT_2552046 [Mycena leptocephala]